MKATGYILYEGPSMLDGKPIVAIVTGFGRKSKNPKTGDMLQTWIMRSDVEPHLAVKTGDDASVCGDCKYRPSNNGGCYVIVGNAPLTVYRAYKRGNYRKLNVTEVGMGAGRFVRIGSYGDPAAVPFLVWKSLLVGATGWTGYTHQWRSCDPRFKEICMASCDTEVEGVTARNKGWRTFRVRAPEGRRSVTEVICPASAEAGYRTTCEVCRACSGTGAKRKQNITIVAHGPVKNRALRVVA